MWGWVAGAVVLALVLMFVFTRGQVTDTTASNVPSRRPRPPVRRHRRQWRRRRTQAPTARAVDPSDAPVKAGNQ